MHVEDIAQLLRVVAPEMLRELGARYGQGYYFGAALRAGDR